MRILMVCIGNICRSPIAEGVMRHKIKKAGLNWTVASAGTQAQIGQTPHKFSLKTCNAKGINIAAQGARRFKAELLGQYDKIYVMSEDVLEEVKKICGEDADLSNVDLFLNELQPGQNNSVPDPIFGPEAWFEIVYNMVDKTCDAIIEKYKQ
jgi:protein-tyrosine phosphatase